MPDCLPYKPVQYSFGTFLGMLTSKSAPKRGGGGGGGGGALQNGSEGDDG